MRIDSGGQMSNSIGTTVAEELLLLSMDEEYGEALTIPARNLGYALAGAVLMELSLLERIDTGTDTLNVTNSEPVGDDLLDPVLADIVDTSGEPRTPEFWVRRIASGSEALRQKTLERLAEQGAIEADDSGLFSLSRKTRHARYHSAPQSQQDVADIRLRISQVIFSDEIPDIRSIVLIGLANACDMFKHMLSETEYEAASERIELISRLELLNRSVVDAIQNLTLSESQFLRREMQKSGGGWPTASGHLPLLGHALQFRNGLQSFLVKQYQELGPVFEVSLPRQKQVILAGPEANQFYQSEGKDYFQSNRAMWRGFTDQYGASKMITALDGADHLRLRKELRNNYSRRVILHHLPEATAAIDRELEEFSLNRPYAIHRLTQRVVIQQLGILMAGNAAQDYVEDIKQYARLIDMVYLLRLYPKITRYKPKYRRAASRMRKLLEDVIITHDTGLSKDEDPDLVDTLLELRRTSPDFLTDTDLFINMLGPYMAGIDTSSGSTSFMLYTLLKQPGLLEQVREEADRAFLSGAPTADDLRNMPTTHEVIMETLRLYPIVPVLIRTVANSFKFGEYWIPAGTNVWLASTVSHHLPEVYPDPYVFDVGRFSPERREHRQPGAYAPFGLGMHSCLGQGAAQAQMALIVATILHRAEIALDPPDYELKVDHWPIPRPSLGCRIRVSKWRDEPSV